MIGDSPTLRAAIRVTAPVYCLVLNMRIHYCTLAVYLQRLGDMTEQDAWEEGGYTLEEYQKVWRISNGHYDPDVQVYVVKFSVHYLSNNKKLYHYKPFLKIGDFYF